MFSLSVIINKCTTFIRLRLYSDLRVILIFFLLKGTDKILRAMSLLFLSQVFQSFCSAGKSVFPLIIIDVWRKLCNTLWILFLYDVMLLLLNMQNSKLCIAFFGLMVACLSFIHLGQSIKELPLFSSIVWNCAYVRSTHSNT